MALLATYGPSNKSVRQYESSRKVRTAIFIAAAQETLWLVEATTTEAFDYVGMTLAAAQTCYAAMVAAYTKQKTIPAWDAQNQEFTESTVSDLVAEIKIVPAGGLMYNVTVDRSEKDVTVESFITA
jgi:hypothetical protein